MACGVSSNGHSSLRIEALSASLSQHLNDRISIDQGTSLSSSKAHRDVGSHSLALSKHLIFQVQLLADDRESLVQNLVRALVGSGLNGQVDEALLFGFEIDRHPCPHLLSR